MITSFPYGRAQGAPLKERWLEVTGMQSTFQIAVHERWIWDTHKVWLCSGIMRKTGRRAVRGENTEPFRT